MSGLQEKMHSPSEGPLFKLLKKRDQLVEIDNQSQLDLNAKLGRRVEVSNKLRISNEELKVRELSLFGNVSVTSLLNIDKTMGFGRIIRGLLRKGIHTKEHLAQITDEELKSIHLPKTLSPILFVIRDIAKAEAALNSQTLP